MKLKILTNNAINFAINRVIEIGGIAILITGIFLLASLISFSPDDPNFIFPDNSEIKNIFGFRGSFTADIFFQSFGVIALLIPFSLMISGVNIILNKKIYLIIESVFYTILYALLGSLFFSFYYPVAFELYIYGNGGFVGKYLETTFLNSILNINYQIFYYILFLSISILFFQTARKLKIFLDFVEVLPLIFFFNLLGL